MVKQKSDILSVNHKTEGNKLFMKQEYFMALEEYNKALCFAQSKENLGFAYGNRSAVYFKLKKYDECLLNIQWARENNYPQEKIQKLNEREENCLQLKAAQIKDPVDELRDFFKLSYPAHPKVPFVADCLTLGEKKGSKRRGIFTSRDLKPGDIISVEKYVFKNVHKKYAHTRCCKCIKPNMLNLIPCSKSASLMFCSEKCRQEVYEKVKNLDSMLTLNGKANVVERILFETEEAFGGRENLMNFIKTTNYANLDCTVFDFDFNNPDDPNYKANLMKCILSLSVRDGNFDHDNFISSLEPLVRTAVGNDQELAKFILYLSLTINTNQLGVMFAGKTSFHWMEGDNSNLIEQEQVITVSAFISHINHRCKPNAFIIPTEDGWLLYVHKLIKAGSEVYRSYFFGPHDRTPNELEKIYNAKIMTRIKCECSNCLYGTPEIPPTPIECVAKEKKRCNNEWSITNIVTNFTPEELDSYSAYSHTIKRVKLNWRCLAEYYAKFETNPEYNLLSHHNAAIVTLLGHVNIFPCVAYKSLWRPFN